MANKRINEISTENSSPQDSDRLPIDPASGGVTDFIRIGTIKQAVRVFSEINAPTPVLPYVARPALFDNSKDPAWLDICQDKSWYNEARSTIGACSYGAGYANAAAAVAAGGIVGNVYYNITTVQFEEITNATVGSEASSVTYRAGSQKFPMRGFVTAEAGRPIIWDSTGAAPTMLMVGPSGLGTITSVKMLGHTIVIGSSTGVWIYDFVASQWRNHNATGVVYYSPSSFTALGTAGTSIASGAIVSATVNDVALTYLSDAPVVNGVRVPTVPIGAASGANWVKQDGTVIAATGAVSIISADIDKDGRTLFASTSKIYVFNSVPTASTTLAAADYIFDTAGTAGPHIDGTISAVKWAGDDVLVGTSTGLFKVRYNVATPAASIVDRTDATSATGGMCGDIRRAIGYDSASVLADKSVKAGLPAEVGTLTKTPVAGGRTAVSGFSAANYIQEATSADFNALGTGDCLLFHASGVKWGTSGSTRTLFSAGDGSTAGSTMLRLEDATDNLVFRIHNGTDFATHIIRSTSSFNDTAEHDVKLLRRNGAWVIEVDGIEQAYTTVGAPNAQSISNATGNYRIGEMQQATFSSPWTGGQFSGYVRISATAPTAEGSKFIADQENALNGGALCLLPAAAVVNLTYDTSTDVYGVFDAANESKFKGLKRISTAAHGLTNPRGDYGSGDTIKVGSAGGGAFTRPAQDITADLKALQLTIAELNQRPVFKQITTDAAGVLTFPQGFKPVRVNATSGTYVSLVTNAPAFDGFVWSISGLTATTAYDCEIVRN